MEGVVLKLTPKIVIDIFIIIIAIFNIILIIIFTIILNILLSICQFLNHDRFSPSIPDK